MGKNERIQVQEGLEGLRFHKLQHLGQERRLSRRAQLLIVKSLRGESNHSGYSTRVAKDVTERVAGLANAKGAENDG